MTNILRTHTRSRQAHVHLKPDTWSRVPSFVWLFLFSSLFLFSVYKKAYPSRCNTIVINFSLRFSINKSLLLSFSSLPCASCFLFFVLFHLFAGFNHDGSWILTWYQSSSIEELCCAWFTLILDLFLDISLCFLSLSFGSFVFFHHG